MAFGKIRRKYSNVFLSILRQCVLNRDNFLPSPIISTYFKVFSRDDEDILNKIIKARETYVYVEYMCMDLKRKKVAAHKRHTVENYENHTF